MNSFFPQPNEKIQISGCQYWFVEFSQASNLNMAYSAEGRKAIVYQLSNNNKEKYALKVFKPLYRISDPDAKSSALLSLKTYPSLKVCEYTCITKKNNQQLINQWPELEYAVLMPWIDGETWFDILNKKEILTPEACIKLALLFLKALVTYETNSLAHCDISSANIILQFDRNKFPTGVQFIDLDDFYCPGFKEPSTISTGTAGYGHPSIKGSGAWNHLADRFSGAIFLAEILCWHDPNVRKCANGESYFSDSDIQNPDSQRYKILRGVLSDFGVELGKLFDEVWESKDLSECPTFKQWMETLELVLTSEYVFRRNMTSAIKSKNDPAIIAVANEFKLNNIMLTKDEWFAYSMALRKTRALTNLQIAINQGNEISILSASDPIVLPTNAVSLEHKLAIEKAEQRMKIYFPLRRAIDKEDSQAIADLYDPSLFDDTKLFSHSDQTQIQLALNPQSASIKNNSVAVETGSSKHSPSSAASVSLSDISDHELIELWIKGNVSEKKLASEQEKKRLNSAIINYGASLRLKN